MAAYPSASSTIKLGGVGRVGHNSATSQPLMIRGSVFFWARYSPGARRHWFNFPQGIASNLTSDRRTASFWASGVPAVRAEIIPAEPVWV